MTVKVLSWWQVSAVNWTKIHSERNGEKLGQSHQFQQERALDSREDCKSGSGSEVTRNSGKEKPKWECSDALFCGVEWREPTKVSEYPSSTLRMVKALVENFKYLNVSLAGH